MRSNRCSIIAGLVLAGILTGPAQAQYGDYAPPPPPPPPPPAPGPEAGPPPPPPAAAYPPATQPQRRARYRPSPYGRFYVGAGAGYVWPGNELGSNLRGNWAYGVWTGWRKRWLGFELGYLGAKLRYEVPDVIFANGGDVAVNTPQDGVAPQASVMYPDNNVSLSHITADAKVFIRLFCSTSLYARLGVNYTGLKLGGGEAMKGFGYQYGGGFDIRIRLSYRPNLVLKLRAEVVQIQADLRSEYDTRRYGLSGLYTMLYVNLGWSPSR